MLSVSIVLPCYHRGYLLEKTLKSFEKYPNLEVIIVEDDYDGDTEPLAKKYDAKYLHHQRENDYPPFQSVAKVFNLGIKAAKNEVIILQAPEVYHIGNVISQLVTPLEKNPRSRVIARTEALDEERKILGSSGARPQAILKSTLEEIGCFEEHFFGYGCEDDFLVWLLERNGVRNMNTSALTAHQWHPSTPFEPFTGHANRAVCWTLTAEILWENRPAIANFGPLAESSAISESELQFLVQRAKEQFVNTTYSNWAQHWLHGTRNDDDTFEARNIASAAMATPETFRTGFIAKQAAEAAWALQWAKKCWDEYMEMSIYGHSPSWDARLLKCHAAHQKLASIAYRTGMRVLNGEEPRI